MFGRAQCSVMHGGSLSGGSLSGELTIAVHVQATQGCKAQHHHFHLPHSQQQLSPRSQWHSQHSGSQQLHEPPPIRHAWLHTVSFRCASPVHHHACLIVSSREGAAAHVALCMNVVPHTALRTPTMTVLMRVQRSRCLAMLWAAPITWRLIFCAEVPPFAAGCVDLL